MNTQGKFYLGRIFDPENRTTTSQPLLFDPADLTTHAVVVGMTGSGKTGLCIDLIEEAALNGIPALMIDPKGDITNALLHFPDLAPDDFQPWVDADQARREGKTVEQVAVESAKAWQEGLAGWGIDRERLQALAQAAHYAIYTPGSDAGIPVSILASLNAPPIPWEGNREILREKITSTVTALLGLVGLKDIDPVRSREHILLANIFEHAWSQGKDIELSELILQTQSPPFSKLGVFDVNTFFPEKDRFELAMLLNNILAAPSFQTWIEGQPLDIQQLLFTPNGKPRHSVFYIAHLSDAERMFFVTLLFTAVESWMRSQTGTANLRSILYFDEIFGYLPPVSNPPSKEPMLRMLKQARAFGVGLVLVTQNPVDVDYKALSNAGAWFIGKLQTDQDKQRLLDGLQGASPALERGQYDRLISSLGKRVFLLHNVHEKEPHLFQTRWAMNYLPGPLTRVQIPALNRMVGALSSAGGTGTPAVPEERTSLSDFQPVPIPQQEIASPGGRPAETSQEQFSEMSSITRPTVPSGIPEYFLPNNVTATQAFKAAGRVYPENATRLGIIYKPALLAQASIRFFNRKYNLDYELQRTALSAEPDRRGVVRWEENLIRPVDVKDLDSAPDPQARFAPLEAPFSEARMLNAIQKDFLDWAYRDSQALLRANEALKVYAGPEISHADFLKMSSEAAREGRDAELLKVSDSYDKKIEALNARLAREQRELDADETELSQRKMEELGTAAENVLGLFTGRRRRRISSSLSKHRMTERAKADVEESREAIEGYKKEILALEKEKEAALEAVNDRWSQIANQTSEIAIKPYKKDVLLELYGVAWTPYHVIESGDEIVQLPGYGD